MKKHCLDGKILDYKKHSIIVTGKNKILSNMTVAFVSADKPEAVNGLGRKLPHYGKYSYLAFEGIAPTNFLKGQWSTDDTPLIVHLDKLRQKPILKPRKPLIESSYN